jgi:hypothetical protein
MINMKEDYLSIVTIMMTRPDLTVSNVVKYAENMGLRLIIAFAEHVRKTSDWIPDILTKYNILLAANISLK